MQIKEIILSKREHVYVYGTYLIDNFHYPFAFLCFSSSLLQKHINPNVIAVIIKTYLRKSGKKSVHLLMPHAVTCQPAGVVPGVLCEYASHFNALSVWLLHLATTAQ